MKKSIICLTLSCMILASCNKDHGYDIIKTLTINDYLHSFVNDDGKPYYQNTLISQQDRHTYLLNMTRGESYRIAATQPEALINQVTMTLVNLRGDTLAESFDEGISKALIVLESPETASYYLHVSLIKRTNPQFKYRLFFEELTEQQLFFSGYPWITSGNWDQPGMGTMTLSNSDSHIYRHLRFGNTVTGTPNISFYIQNSSGNGIDFGIVMDASTNLMQFSEYAWELPESGYAFMAFRGNMNYSFIRLSSGSMSLDWGSLSNVNLDFTTGVKVELKNQSGYYSLYLNGIYIRGMSGTLRNFTILVQDEGEGMTTVRDFTMVQYY